MLREYDRGRPGEERPRTSLAGDLHSVPRRDDMLADLDALAESLRARFAVQVTIDDAGHRRTYLYRSAAAAERCAARAHDRGRSFHVTLVQFVPVGVVSGLVAR